MGKDPVSAGGSPVSVTMLGGFRIRTGGHVLTDEVNRSLKLWNVLCYLIAHRDRTIPQAEFAELFWAEKTSVNPANALKTLLYRVRGLLEPLFGDGPEPVLSLRGGYAWNPAVVCEVDADRFEALCRRAEDQSLSDRARIALYQEAAELYQGDYLPKLSGQVWVSRLAARYRALYISSVKECAVLLERTHQYDEMTALCRRAGLLAPLDEGLHILVVRALLCQGKDAEALSHYEQATDRLYRSLGVRPSEELRALYAEIMDVEKSLETDLAVIQGQLKETADRPGAFVCEYGFFKEAYRLEARRAVRSGTSVHVGLITVSQQDGTAPPLKDLNSAMDQLLEVLAGNLRRGDVVSRYSGAQYVVLLPAANFEDSMKVMDRVVSAFYRHHRRSCLKLSYKIRELELS